MEYLVECIEPIINCIAALGFLVDSTFDCKEQIGHLTSHLTGLF